MNSHYIESFFTKDGYQKLTTNSDAISAYFKANQSEVYIINVIDMGTGIPLLKEQISKMHKSLQDFFTQKGYGVEEILTIVLSDNLVEAKQLSIEDANCWIVHKSMNRLIIYENQITDFHNIRKPLEIFLENAPMEDTSANQKETTQNLLKKIGQLFTSQPVNMSILVLNILIFILCTFTGDLLYNKGAFSIYYILDGKEYYRFLTSMFLHANADHIISNMLLLVLIGAVVENYLGHVAYGLIYLVAGIMGSLLSACYELITSSFSESVGASGAIFGIVGALLAIVLLHKGRFANITMTRLIFMIIYSIYSGITATNVNNAAHIGGLFGGFVITLVYCLFRKRDRKVQVSQNEN